MVSHANETHILYVLDKSGSMVDMGNAPVISFNNFLKEQQSLKIENTFLTMIKFNNDVDIVYNKLPIDDVPLLTSFVVDGTTSLCDAIGTGINLLKDKENVSVLIFTDGEENSSKTFDRTKIKKLVEEMEKEHKWNFVYLGANQDSILIGHTIGIRNCVNFDPSEHGLIEITRGVSDSLTKFRSGDSDSINLKPTLDSIKSVKPTLCLKPTYMFMPTTSSPVSSPKNLIDPMDDNHPRTPTKPLSLTRSNCDYLP